MLLLCASTLLCLFATASPVPVQPSASWLPPTALEPWLLFRFRAVHLPVMLLWVLPIAPLLCCTLRPLQLHRTLLPICSFLFSLLLHASHTPPTPSLPLLASLKPRLLAVSPNVVTWLRGWCALLLTCRLDRGMVGRRSCFGRLCPALVALLPSPLLLLLLLQLPSLLLLRLLRGLAWLSCVLGGE